jgi:hypothetical protein
VKKQGEHVYGIRETSGEERILGQKCYLAEIGNQVGDVDNNNDNNSDDNDDEHPVPFHILDDNGEWNRVTGKD